MGPGPAARPLPLGGCSGPRYLQCRCSLLCGVCTGFCCPRQRTCRSRRRRRPGRHACLCAARSGPGTWSRVCCPALWRRAENAVSLASVALEMGSKMWLWPQNRCSGKEEGYWDCFCLQSFPRCYQTDPTRLNFLLQKDQTSPADEFPPQVSSGVLPSSHDPVPDKPWASGFQALSPATSHSKPWC